MLVLLTPGKGSDGSGGRFRFLDEDLRRVGGGHF
jgi:hypothetical protein